MRAPRWNRHRQSIQYNNSGPGLTSLNKRPADPAARSAPQADGLNDGNGYGRQGFRENPCLNVNKCNKTRC